MSMKILLLVGLGGFAGSVLRYGVGLIFPNRVATGHFPWATLAVNLVGCLLIGIFYGLAQRYSWFGQQARLLLITGLCGGFTTFSAFAYEGLALLQQGRVGLCAGYLGASVFIGLLLVWAGYALCK